MTVKRLEWVRQSGSKDCGVSCLLMIVRYYHGNVTKEYLRELTHTSKDGVSAYFLVEAAKKIGFSAKGLKGDYRLLKRQDLPMIAHLTLEKNYQHFVVLTKIDKRAEKVTLLDPSRGTRNIHFKDFDKISTNRYVYLKPNKPLPQMRQKRILPQIIFALYRNYPYLFIKIFVLSLFYIVLSMVLAFSAKYFMEEAITPMMFQSAKVLFYSLLGFGILKMGCTFLKQREHLYVNQAFQTNLVESTLRQLLFLPHLYYKNRTTGEITSRIQDLEVVSSFLERTFSCVTDSLFLLVLSCFLYIIERRFLFLFLGVGVITFLFLFLFRKSLAKSLTDCKVSAGLFQSQFVESLEGMECIKGLHLEEEMLDTLTSSYRSFFRKRVKLTQFYSLLTIGKEGLFELGNLLFCLLGSYLVIEGKLSLSSFIVYQSFLSYYVSLLEGYASLLLDYQEARVSLERIQELYDVRMEDFRYRKNYELQPDLGEISIRHLSYHYVPSTAILDDLSLEITKGSKVLLYGDSGSGKSTLAKMLMRYFEVPSNHLFLAKEDINRFHLSYLREHITYVSQTDFLFTKSIYENVTLNREVSYSEFLRVAKMTGIDKLVQNDQIGYDRLLEENGFNLSGGERERIIIARALLKESDLYIFDESFHQIDIASEREILKNIFEWKKDQTILVISHRFDNCDLFDQKMKLEKGKINENA